VKRKTVIYARVSTPKQKKDLENQVEMLKSWAFNTGYSVHNVYEDVASSISFGERLEFFEMLDEIIEYKIEIIIAHKDRLCRVVFELFSYLFSHYGTNIIVVSDVGNKKLDEKEIFEEIESLTQCYSIKTYSKRGNKRLEIEQKE